VSSHEIAQLRKIAEPIPESQQRIVNDQASAKFLRPPDNVWEDEFDEHNERNDRAEMGFNVVEAVAYRLIDVNHLRACAEENGSTVVLKPKEDRSTSSRNDSRTHRFSADWGTNQNGILTP
jgi:hypothetical protein